MSFLVLDAGAGAEPRSALLLDAGSGVGRLVEPELAPRLAAIERLDVILTHYHLDHVCGLPGLSATLRNRSRSAAAKAKTIVLWAPAPPLVDGSPHEALERLFSPPLFPSSPKRFLDTVDLREYSAARDLQPLNRQLNLSDPGIHLRRQQHPGGSVGLRFSDQFAYITDTCPDPGTIDLVRGVDLLLHEVWVSQQQAATDPSLVTGHSDTQSVREIAEQAAVRRLMPVHRHPQNSESELVTLDQELACSSFELVAPVEGDSYPIDRQ